MSLFVEGTLENENRKTVAALYAQGLDAKEIAKRTGMKVQVVESFLAVEKERILRDAARQRRQER